LALTPNSFSDGVLQVTVPGMVPRYIITYILCCFMLNYNTNLIFWLYFL